MSNNSAAIPAASEKMLSAVLATEVVLEEKKKKSSGSAVKKSSEGDLKPPGIDRSKLSSSYSKDKALKKSGGNNPKKPKVFGVVEVYDIEGRPVAVKMLQLKQKELDGGAPYLEGFDAQVVSLVALRNPHLVEIYGKVESSPFTYFMEYIPETTLEKYIVQQRERLSYDDRFEFAKSIADGMMYLHYEATIDFPEKTVVVHSNLKSSSVLMFRDQQGVYKCKISGFGFGEFRADFIRKKRIHVNSAYFAPELRQMLKFTKKTDVYAYGIILLELYLTTKSRVALKDFKDKIKDSNAVPSSISILINSSLQLLDKKRPNFVQISESLESNMDVIKSFIPVLSSALPPVAATGRTDLSMTVFDMSGTSSKRKCQLLQSKRSRIILSISILIFIVLIALITVVIKMFLPAAASSEKTSSGSSTNSISTSSSLSFSWTANSSWGGINSEFLYALSSDQQDQIISATVGANLKTIRIIIRQIPANFLNSGNSLMNDVDTADGTYDDTILNAIDNLMVKMETNGLKLVIVLHDRNSLGCNSNDAYVTRFNLPSNSPNFDCYHYPNEVSLFYNNISAAVAIDARFKHVLMHENAHYKNRIWASLNNVIYAIELENYAQYRISSPNYTWACDRAKAVRTILNNQILVSTGGGGNFANSLHEEYFKCTFIDIIAVSSLSTNEFFIINTTNSLLAPLSAKYPQKEVMFNSIGALDNRPQYFSRVFSSLNSLHLKWMVWDIIMESASNTGFFEFFNDDSSWRALSQLGSDAITNSATNNLLIAPNSGWQCNSCLADWQPCVDDIECLNSISCCTSIFSGGMKKCSPGAC